VTFSLVVIFYNIVISCLWDIYRHSHHRWLFRVKWYVYDELDRIQI